MEDHLSDHTFSQLAKAFPNLSQDSLKMVKKHVQSLAGFWLVCYSCCINSCVCFVGPYKDLVAFGSEWVRTSENGSGVSRDLASAYVLCLRTLVVPNLQRDEGGSLGK